MRTRLMSFIRQLVIISLWLALIMVAPAPNVRAAGPTCTVNIAGGADYTTIHDAVYDNGCTTINVAAGTYNNEQIPIGRNVTINGASRDSTIVIPPSGLTGFTIDQYATNAVLANLTLKGSTGTKSIDNSGTLILNNVVVTLNPGTAISNAGNLTLNNSQVSANQGTGIFNTGNLTLNNSQVSTSQDTGIVNKHNLTVNGSTFMSNGSYSGSGGGIYNDSTGTITVTNTHFGGNISQSGGGIDNHGGMLTVNNSLFSGNTASLFGGGIYNDSYGTVTVNNSTFADNNGNADGGGIDNESGNLTVNNSTFVGNYAPYSGSGIRSAGSVMVRNTIIANSRVGGNCAFAFPNGTNNLSDDATCGAGFTNSSTILIGARGNYGGSTQTIPLVPGSAAIDAGNDATCAALPGGNLDQRGKGRVGTHCDIGAFESQGFTLGSLTGTPQATAINTVFAWPLGLTVTPNNAGDPVAGGQVTFTPPGSGASATLTGNPATIAADGTASVTATANGTTGGPYTVTASTGGAATSVSYSLNNTAANMGSTTSLTSSPNPSTSGQAVLFMATVTGSGGTPTGMVTFQDNGTDIAGCSAQPLNGSAQATCSTSTLSPGVHTNITAVYNGNASYNPSRSVPYAQTVGCDNAAVVTNNNDSGAGSLRAAIANANANTCSSGYTITFNGDYTIVLANVLTINKNVTINGAGHSVTLSGNHAVRVFYIDSVINGPITFNLQNLNVVNGQSAGVGGAIVSYGATLTISNATFSDNRATDSSPGNADGDGGAIFINGGSLTVSNSTFSSNGADRGGGAIMNLSTLTVNNSTFSGNSAGNGGAIENTNLSTVMVTNSTFSSNIASLNGGGIYNGGTLNVTNSTFSGNRAGTYGHGGAIVVAGSTTVKNTLLVNSTQGNCYYSINGSNNLADDTTCGAGTSSSSSILLGTLGNYGGSTPTFPVVPGSAAIKATSANCPTTDQRGVARGTTCDVGAYESRGFILSKNAGTDNQRTAVNSAFPSPLALWASSPYGDPVAGGKVTLAAPSSGASATFDVNPAPIQSGGGVSVNATANGTAGGPYTVTVSAIGANSVNFSLTNTPPVQTGPTFIVNTTDDHDDSLCQSNPYGDCTLREALYAAAGWSGASTIHFAVGDNQTFTFTTALSGGNNPGQTMTVDGENHGITLSGAGTFRTLFVNGGGTFNLQNLTIANGYCGASNCQGGGLSTYNGGISSRSITLNVNNVTFSGNTGGAGGAIYNQIGTVNVTNSTFNGNSVSSSGGSLYNAAGMILTVKNTTFYNNSANMGGAIYSQGTLTMTNSTLSGNAAGNTSGGGIYNEGGTATVQNSLIANSPTGGNCAGTIGGLNNVADDATCGAGFTTSSSILLGALGNYGGGTQVFPLLPGSAAIDATNTNCPATDQRGVARGATCDLGAFESRGFTLAKAGGDNQTASINSPFANPLALAVSSAHSEPVNGGQVILTAPTSGASIMAATPLTLTIASGAVSQAVTANGTVGPYSVTASASGATSVAFALRNTGTAASTTTLASSPNPSLINQTVVFTATVTGSGSTPTGAVRFQDNGTDISGCSAQPLDGSGQATCSTSALSLGTHTNITARYSGDDNFVGSISSPYSQIVDCANATIVMNNNDSGVGSLRAALVIPNVCPSGYTITFDGDYTITLSNILTINRNIAVDGTGHNVTIDGHNILDFAVEIPSNVTFNLQNLSVKSGQWGGIWNYGGGTLNITNVTFPGGIGVGIENDYGTATVTNSTFAGNTANGIFNQDKLTVINSTFSGNILSYNNGGGIYNNGGTVMVIGSTFTGNSASYGSGIFTSGGAVTVTNSTFSGNNADSGGAGIFNDFGTVTVRNSVIANSTTGGNCSGTIGGSNNLADDATCGAGFTNSSTILLGALGNYGGNTQTILLLPGSAAIDMADAAYCPATDQRGAARDDLRCDIGAYELKYTDSPTVIRSTSAATMTTFGPALIGIQRDAVVDPGVITVTKSLTWRTKPDNTIDAYWLITPTVDTGLNLTMMLCYSPAESNGLAQNALRFWKYSAGAWNAVPGTPVTSNVNGNLCATLTGINELSVWTLGTDSPTAVRLMAVTAQSGEANFIPIVLALISAVGLLSLIGARRKFRSRA